MNGRQIIEKVYGSRFLGNPRCSSCKWRYAIFNSVEYEQYCSIENGFGTEFCAEHTCLEFYKLLGKKEYDKFVKWFRDQNIAASPCSNITKMFYYFDHCYNNGRMEIL